jgi:hypothetical protein
MEENDKKNMLTQRQETKLAIHIKQLNSGLLRTIGLSKVKSVLN